MSDLAGLDIIGNCSSHSIDLISSFIPQASALRPLAPDMEFLYIASTTEPTWTTPKMYVRPTHTYDTAPRDLDIILLAGPDPSRVPEASLKFLREASLQSKVILTTCTGGMWLARSGVLDGKKATTNRMLLEAAKEAMPKVEWVDRRWVVDEGCFEGAQIWTAGGAKCGECVPSLFFFLPSFFSFAMRGRTAADGYLGIDMVIEFAFKILNEKLVKIGCMGLEYEIEGRSQVYAGPMVNPF